MYLVDQTKKLKSNLHSYNISTKIETVLDKEYTLSVFAKATDKSNLILALGGAENKATFSLSDLRVIEKSKHIIKTNIKSTNSGYIRCSITGKFLNTNTVLLGIANLNGDYKYSSDNRDFYYKFLNEDYENLYNAEQRQLHIFSCEISWRQHFYQHIGGQP